MAEAQCLKETAPEVAFFDTFQSAAVVNRELQIELPLDPEESF